MPKELLSYIINYMFSHTIQKIKPVNVSSNIETFTSNFIRFKYSSREIIPLLYFIISFKEHISATQRWEDSWVESKHQFHSNPSITFKIYFMWSMALPHFFLPCLINQVELQDILILSAYLLQAPTIGGSLSFPRKNVNINKTSYPSLIPWACKISYDFKYTIWIIPIDY